VERITSDPKAAWIKLIESQECINNRYKDIERIDPNAGDGKFSLVFTATDNEIKRHKRVVLKFLNPLEGDRYRQQCFHREADILKDLNGQKNILPLIQEKTRFELIINGITFPLYFYSSYLARFNVRYYIYNGSTNYLTNILFFREMCKAVQRIHNKRICHRDLKPGNFLVYGKRYVCLSDFGTARYFGSKADPILSYYPYPVGDMRYTAPELLCGLYFSDYYNYYADIYSLGLILFELFTKVQLGSEIFRNPERMDLISHFRLVPERNRIEVFDESIESFAKAKDLFSVRMYDDSIPKAIAQEIDKLYQGMVCLDYRKREVDFQRIFLRINICEKVIRNFKKYEKWKKRKEKKKEGASC